MAGGDGPWEKREPIRAQSEAPRGRLMIWLAILAVIAACVGLLFKAFPGVAESSEDAPWVIRSALILGLLSTGVLTARRIDWGEKARHAAIWVCIVGVLVLGVTYQPELTGVGQRVRSAFSPASPVAVGPQEFVVTQDASGSFLVMGKVNGQPVRFLVDTGASDTVLSPADAERIGIDVAGLRFDQTAETANGLGYGATFTADSLQVGSIAFADMPMVINKAPMSASLLGMSFLSRLETFHVRDGRLYLKARG